MFGLVVRFTLKDGATADFDRLIEITVPEIRRHEPGTLVYAVHQVDGEPNTRIFYELYRDRAAFDEHERQEHTRRFLAERERYLSGPPQVDFLALQTAAGAVEAQ
jgi:quinol monooxygenase YgiN